MVPGQASTHHTEALYDLIDSFEAIETDPATQRQIDSILASARVTLARFPIPEEEEDEEESLPDDADEVVEPEVIESKVLPKVLPPVVPSLMDVGTELARKRSLLQDALRAFAPAGIADDALADGVTHLLSGLARVDAESEAAKRRRVSPSVPPAAEAEGCAAAK